jgi:hypothetical protein
MHFSDFALNTNEKESDILKGNINHSVRVGVSMI